MRLLWLVLSFLVMLSDAKAIELLRFNPPHPGKMVSTFSLPGVYLRNQIEDSNSYPYRTMGHITMQGGSCSGTLIGPRHVLTAAHCIYDIDKRSWYTNFKFFPGRLDTKKLPFNPVDWEKIYVPRVYSQLRGDSNSLEAFKHDYAVIVLKTDVGNILGWLGFGIPTDSADGNDVYMAGYPGDKPFGTFWSVHCPVGRVNNQLVLECDAFGGMSGSSIRLPTAKGDVVIGVFDWGQTEKNGFNGGVAIRENIYQQLLTWVNGKVNEDETVILSNSEKDVSLYIRNSCPSKNPAQVAGYYMNNEDQWVSMPVWSMLNYGEVMPLGSTEFSRYYYAAKPSEQNASYQWLGDDLSLPVSGQNIGFIKKELSPELRPSGIEVLNLTCK